MGNERESKVALVTRCDSHAREQCLSHLASVLSGPSYGLLSQSALRRPNTKNIATTPTGTIFIMAREVDVVGIPVHQRQERALK